MSRLQKETIEMFDYHKKYYQKNRERILERQKKYNKTNGKSKFRKWYRKEHPNVKHYDSYCDFETHHKLAINSGIESSHEWAECHKMGLMPDMIYADPSRAFRRK